MSNETQEDLWEFLCWDCRWRGVAQELGQNEALEEYWHCPRCDSINIEQMGWHLGDNRYTGKQ